MIQFDLPHRRKSTELISAKTDKEE